MNRTKKSIQWLMIILVLIILSLASVAMIGAFSWRHSSSTYSSKSAMQQQFIQALLPSSQEVYRRYQVLPSISLAQAILESNWGESLLASDYYNLYGIKARETEPHVYLETSEFVNGTWLTVKGRFRVYNSWEESVDAHAQLFVYGVDWNPSLYHPVLHATDYKQAAEALQVAGYATDPDYANKLIELIERYHLEQYDTLLEISK